MPIPRRRWPRTRGVATGISGEGVDALISLSFGYNPEIASRLKRAVPVRWNSTWRLWQTSVANEALVVAFLHSEAKHSAEKQVVVTERRCDPRDLFGQHLAA